MATRRKLGFESLEAREVCAGDVSVTVVAGELRVVGDNAANFVNIQRQLSGGELKFIVTGIPFRGQFDAAGDPIAASSGNDATLLNGQAAPAEFVAQRVNVSMRAGNDAVTMSGSNTAFEVTALQAVMGTGNDYLKISSANVTGKTATNLRMTQVGGVQGRSELGRDKLELNGFITITADTNIFTGGGNDKIHMLSSDFRGVGVGVIADAGDGVDDIKFTSAAVALTVNGGAGNETILLSGIIGDATLNGGNGVEKITVKSVRMGELTVNAGNGADVLALENTQIDKVTANMGASAERDVVTSDDLDSREVTVNLGAGNNDLLKLGGRSSVRGGVSFNGGAGTGDTLQIVGPFKVRGTRTVTGFEVKPAGF